MCIIPLATLVCYLFVLHHFFMCKRQYTAWKHYPKKLKIEKTKVVMYEMFLCKKVILIYHIIYKIYAITRTSRYQCNHRWYREEIGVYCKYVARLFLLHHVLKVYSLLQRTPNSTLKKYIISFKSCINIDIKNYKFSVYVHHHHYLH